MSRSAVGPKKSTSIAGAGIGDGNLDSQHANKVVAAINYLMASPCSTVRRFAPRARRLVYTYTSKVYIYVRILGNKPDDIRLQWDADVRVPSTLLGIRNLSGLTKFIVT